MDALDVAKVWFRRWYLTVPVLLLAVFSGIQLAHQAAVQYHGTATFALIYADTAPRPANSPDPREQNPMALNDGSLLGQAILEDLQTPAEQEKLGGSDVSGTAPGQPSNGGAFTVSLPVGALTYTVDTWGHDPKQVSAVVDRVLQATKPLAEDIQTRAGAPLKSRYEPFVTTHTQVVQLPAASPAKLLVAMAAVGLAAGAALALVLDRLLARRSERRAKRRSEQAETDGPTPAGPTPAGRPVRVRAPKVKRSPRPSEPSSKDPDAGTRRPGVVPAGRAAVSARGPAPVSTRPPRNGSSPATQGDQEEFRVGGARNNGRR